MLKKRINFDQDNERLEEVLLSLANEGGFSFSYNPDLLPVDQVVSIHKENSTIKSVLTELLGSDLEYRISGNVLVILNTKFSPDIQSAGIKNKKSYTIDGFLINPESGEYFSNTTVYDLSGLRSTTTDEKGYFSLEIPVKEEVVALGVGNFDMESKPVVVVNKDQNLNIPVIASKGVTGQGSGEYAGGPQMVNTNKIVRLFSDEETLTNTSQMKLANYRFAQASFVPFVGTNLKMSGTVENKVSFNVLAGYNGATNGVELGGLFNINRYYTNGLQIAGLGNVVGTRTNGVQFAGLFNSNFGTVNGVQFSGISNLVLDSLKGVQFAGVTNVARRNVDGMQISGVINTALKDVNLIQLAGVLNFGRNIHGGQIAGVLNTSYGNVGGFQLAGVMNTSRNVKSLQLAGVMNVAIDTVKGLQLSSVFNFARHNHGFQLALINTGFSSKGLSIGLINLFWKGYHKLELHTNELLTYNARVKLGTNKFYNIIGLGSEGFDLHRIWGYSYGIGTSFKLGKKGNELNIDYVMTDLQDDETWFEELVLNGRLSIQYGQKITRGISVFAGPVWSQLYYESDNDQPFIQALLQHSRYEKSRQNWTVNGWYGFEVGIRLF